jgi:hypothetical protein
MKAFGALTTNPLAWPAVNPNLLSAQLFSGWSFEFVAG